MSRRIQYPWLGMPMIGRSFRRHHCRRCCHCHLHVDCLHCKAVFFAVGAPQYAEACAIAVVVCRE